MDTFYVRIPGLLRPDSVTRFGGHEEKNQTRLNSLGLDKLTGWGRDVAPEGVAGDALPPRLPGIPYWGSVSHRAAERPGAPRAGRVVAAPENGGG